MFRFIRRLWKAYKKSLYDSYTPKPTVYKIGSKKYIKVKRLNRPKGQRGPYEKQSMLDILFLFLLIETNKPNETFVMPVPVTYPEERTVLDKYPVLPVEQTTLN